MNTQPMDTIQTVISLPFDLLERTERLIAQGFAANRESLLQTAIEKFIADLEERISIDAQFADMAEDVAFQALNLQITEEFAGSDYEALRLIEDETR